MQCGASLVVLLSASELNNVRWARRCIVCVPQMSTAAQVPESKKDALALIVKTKDDTIKNFLIGALGFDLIWLVSLDHLCAM